MKVLHVAHSVDAAGGVESYLRELLRAQASAGLDVALVTGTHEWRPECVVESFDYDGIPAWRVHRDDLYFHHFAKLYHPEVGTRLEELIRAERPDVVHVHQWLQLTCNIVEIADRVGVPAVVTLHDLYTSCPRCFRIDRDDRHCERPLGLESCAPCVPKFGWESEREIAASLELYRDQYLAELAMARAVVVSSSATRDLIAATTAIDTDRFTLLPLGYEPRFADVATPLAGDGPTLRFGYWGSMTHRKGAHVLVAAFRKLCVDGVPKPVELHLFGRVDTVELEAELQELAAGVPVRFHGRFEYEQLARAGLHVAVFPILCFETYGFVLDESVELGLPCIVTDLGALSARAGDHALRVPPGDVDALAAAMRRFLDEPDLLARLRDGVTEASLDNARHVERLTAIYADAIASERPAGEPLPEWRRAHLLQLQRESAQSRNCPDGGPS